MAAEQKPTRLSITMREVVLGLAANTARLADHLQQALGNGNSPSDEVRAAFGVIRAVATAGEVIVTENTGVIFQTDGTDGILQEQPILPAPAPQLSEVTIPFSLPEAAPTEDTHPTTFGELFEVKLRSLVPAEVISRRKLQSLAGGIHKSWKHRVPQQKTFTNEEAISFMEKLLLTPTSHFKAKSDGYTRWSIHMGFGLSCAQIDSWSDIIGHDWKARKYVGVPEALAIRGLGLLERAQPSLQPSAEGVN